MPSDRIRPIIIALDGIAGGLSVTGFDSVVPVRTAQYLEPALENAWGYYDFLTTEIISVPWGGDLRDYPRLQNYIKLTKATIVNVVKKYPTRPIVIVAHSWGSVVAYQVLSELQSELSAGNVRSVNSNAIALLVTIGSPLASKNPVIRASLRTLPGIVPGEEFVDTTTSKVVLRKPDVVAYWINYWIYNDIFADEKAMADENVRWPSLLPLLDILKQHDAYYTHLPYASDEMADVKRILDNDCKNSYTSATAVPTGYGAAYNVLASDKELLAKMTCHGVYRQPRTAKQRAPGWLW